MPSIKSALTRRKFLVSGAALAASASVPAWFLTEKRGFARRLLHPGASANERPHIGLIGCGGRGIAAAREISPFADVVAVCDVDGHHLANTVEYFPDATQYRDFRKIMGHRGLDAVIVATPDHWHSLISIHAMRQGKDVYCEKPMTLTIDEGKKVVEVARQTNRVFQTGTQQRSDLKFHLGCELVRNGRIGKLESVLVVLPVGQRGGPFEPAAVPQELDWEMWQGQTPTKPYMTKRCHYNFRHWYDYSGGMLTDWGAHHNDIALWGIGTNSGPTSVEAQRLSEPVPGGFTTVADFRVTYRYANGVEHVCRTITPDEQEIPAGAANGVKFVGTDGWIFLTRGRIEASNPAMLTEPLPAGAERLYPSDQHFYNFVHCIRTRQPTACGPEIGHRSASVCHLGALALRLNRKLQWDPICQVFPNDSEANTYLAREMRKPWSYEAV
jgi:predicted dehydrogenase